MASSSSSSASPSAHHTNTNSLHPRNSRASLDSYPFHSPSPNPNSNPIPSHYLSWSSSQRQLHNQPIYRIPPYPTPPPRHSQPINSPLNVPSTSSNRNSPASSHQLPLLVPHQSHSLSNHAQLLSQLHHSNTDWFDRPDSRSSSAHSNNTALPPQPPPSLPSDPPPIPLGWRNLQVWSEQWPRQWGWTAVDIPLHGIHALRDQIERPPLNPLRPDDPLDLSQQPDGPESDNAGSGEVLSCSFASDRWKVEVVKGHSRRPSAPSTPTNTTSTSPSTFFTFAAPPQAPDDHALSLYLTCHELEVDWPTSRSISTSILVSIKEPRMPLHAHHALTDLGTREEGWVWRVGCEERCFERESEVWECHSFPSLSSLLLNPRIAMFDSFVLTIQIGCPATKTVPQIPLATYVPHSILNALESLLDDPNTSDLQVLVTETDSIAPPSSPDAPHPRFRKRVLYAHSSVLQQRSEYFKTMLADENNGGGWAESGRRAGRGVDGQRKLGVIKIDDFDFVTVYWLLRYLYSNRIFFADEEDVRAQCQLGSSLTPDMHGMPAEASSDGTLWGWKTYGCVPEDEDGGAETELFETVSESGAAKVAARARGRGSATPTGSGKRRAGPVASTPMTAFVPGRTRVGSAAPGSGASRSREGGLSQLTQSTNPAGKARAGPSAAGVEEGAAGGAAPATAGPDTSTTGSEWVGGEPHAHPVKMNTKASALSIYRLAHRYELVRLQELAMVQLVASLTPKTAFPLLLASYVFPDLYGQVKAYCLANYYRILQEPEFRRCYNEVGDGLWEHGGEVLLSFTMSLMPGPGVV